MKFSIFCIGSLKASTSKDSLFSAIQNYQKLSPAPLEVREFNIKKKLPPAQLKQAESQMILDALPTNAYLILLDERGQNITSRDFAQKIEAIQHEFSHIIFAIGGAFGHDEILRSHAKFLLSFSKMTWPHQMVRLLLAEQIYRAQMILQGHPYHKD